MNTHVIESNKRFQEKLKSIKLNRERLKFLLSNDVFQWYRDCKRQLKVNGYIDKFPSYEDIINGFINSAMDGNLYGYVDFISQEPKVLFIPATLPHIQLDVNDLYILLNCEQNYYKRIIRLKKRIIKLLTYESPVFITLTFTDKVLSNTNSVTRRRYIHYFLKNQCSDYVANIDFGKENGREHYHAISNKRIDPTAWLYGACNVVMINNKDPLRLSKYIHKLTNHSIKVMSKIIYSKK